MRHGGQILIEQLKAFGAKRAFCVPGESYLAALDGLYESGIDTIICRQEGGAAMMAEAHGKMTGEPGLCFVTRGPGASNAAIGVHIAQQDSTPMILFVGQVARGMQDREAFQEVNFQAMFGPLCKWAAEIRQTERIPEYVARAWHTALSGRPGPVVLSLPEDMLSARAEAEIVPKCPTPVAHPGEEDLQAVHDALAGAKRPLMIIGGPLWSKEASEQVAAFAERLALPVVATFRYQDYMDNRHPNYVGNMGIGIDPNLARRIREADWLLVMGPRLGEMTTGGYSLVKAPVPDQHLIHIHPCAEELGRVYRTEVPVQASLRAFAARLADIPTPNNLPWAEETVLARKEYEAFSQPQETPGAVKMEQVVSYVNSTLPENAIVTNGAGNY
ncbi:MAG: thiamine pyrophosphate-binding protein, partial [Alphaproteobacteria bacterium]